MAICASVDSVTGYLKILPTPVGECSSYVILDHLDWLGSSIWALPSLDDAALVWSVGFSLPMTLFLIAWAAGRVISLFDNRG